MIFNNYTYNLSGGENYELFLADNSTAATEGFTLEVVNGVTQLNISKNGDYVLHYTRDGVPTERKFRSIDYLTLFGAGSDWASYRAAVASLGTDDAAFLNPVEQPYLVGTGNAFHFDLNLTSANTANTNVVADENLLVYEFYVQNVCEIHIITINGVQTETKSEYTYDESGNLTSMKNFQDGQLVMEWKDYVWGDKKNTHIEIMYMNGSPMSTTEVTQFYL